MPVDDIVSELLTHGAKVLIDRFIGGPSATPEPDAAPSPTATVVDVTEAPRPGTMGALLADHQRRLDRVRDLMQANAVNDPEFALHINRIIRELYQLLHLSGDYWDETKWEIKAVRKRAPKRGGKRK